MFFFFVYIVVTKIKIEVKNHILSCCIEINVIGIAVILREKKKSKHILYTLNMIEILHFYKLEII